MLMNALGFERLSQQETRIKIDGLFGAASEAAAVLGLLGAGGPGPPGKLRDIGGQKPRRSAIVEIGLVRLAARRRPTTNPGQSSQGFFHFDVRYCVGFWTPVITKDPRARLAGVQKAPRHEVAGSWAPAKQRAL